MRLPGALRWNWGRAGHSRRNCGGRQGAIEIERTKTELANYAWNLGWSDTAGTRGSSGRCRQRSSLSGKCGELFHHRANPLGGWGTFLAAGVAGGITGGVGGH